LLGARRGWRIALGDRRRALAVLLHRGRRLHLREPSLDDACGPAAES
jgi:hypothetical protein